MASPLPSAKQSVNLAAASLRESSGARASKGLGVSRIRRDPPAAVKELAVADAEANDARTVVIGILTFTLALVVILIGVSSIVGWSPRDYVAHL